MLRTSRIVGALTATILAGSVLSAMPAIATTDPRGWGPDSNVVGGLFMYDANGYQITTGSINTAPMASYYEAAAGQIAGSTGKDFVSTATPEQGVNSAAWSSIQQVTSTQAQPLAGLPGQLAGNTANAIVKSVAGDLSLNGYQIANFANNSAVSGYQNLYEVRLYTGNSLTWYSAVVSVSASTWTQVWPVLAPTTVANVPASPTVGTGQAVDLTATATTGIPGSVVFKEGPTVVSSPTAVNTGTGQAAAHITGVADGTHHYTAYFYPTANFATPSAPSVSTVADVAVGAIPADNTATALTVTPGSGRSNVLQAIRAGVSDSTTPATVPVGTVAFYDNGSVTALPGTVTQSPSGTFTLNTLLATGAHSIVAKFTPTNATLFNASQSAARVFSLAAPLTVPAAPTGVAGIPKATSVTAVWRAPANGGSAILQYQVVALPKVGTVYRQCLSTTVTSCTVLGLLNGVGYRFEVRARNALGWGPYSALSAIVIPGAPTAPRALSAVSTAVKVVRVSWAAPLYNGGYAVNLYQVRWSTNGVTWTAWASNGISRTVLHSGFSKGRFAWVQVRARNSLLKFSPAAALRFVPTK